MLSKKLSNLNTSKLISLKKQNIFFNKNNFLSYKGKYLIHSKTENDIASKIKSLKYLHLNNKSNHIHQQKIRTHPIWKYQQKYNFSLQSTNTNTITKSSQPTTINYNNFQLINQLHKQSLLSSVNKLPSYNNQSQQSSQTSSQQSTLAASLFSFSYPISLSAQYNTITLELSQKYQKIQAILNSQERNLFKIVQEMIIVLEAFSQINNKEVLQENLVKVIKQFNGKIINAYLQNIATLQQQQIETTIKTKQFKQQQQLLSSSLTQTLKDQTLSQEKQQNDSNYELHQNFNPILQKRNNNHNNDLDGNNNKLINKLLDSNFILFYLETLKQWILTRIDNNPLIKIAEHEIYQLFNTREVSAFMDIIQGEISQLQAQYINEPQPLKRQLYPFVKKIRLIALLPFFQSKELIQAYISRLADQNLIIYFKEGQMISLMYDIVEIQPVIDCKEFVYQIQATKVYQNFFNLNSSYIKAKFIEYVRKYLVCYQQIQFYQIFRQIQTKMRYPSIRSFSRLTKILKIQADDLHCQYNKVMNRYNFNILISLITSQNYNVEVVKFCDFLDVFETLNELQKAGQTLFDDLTRFLKYYHTTPDRGFTQSQLNRLYKIFVFIINQTKAIYKYQQKDGLNRQLSKKTFALTKQLFEILSTKYPQVFIIGRYFIPFYLKEEQTFMDPPSSYIDQTTIMLTIFQGNNFNILKQRLEKLKQALTKFNVQKLRKICYPDPSNEKPIFTLSQYFETISLLLKLKIQKKEVNPSILTDQNAQQLNTISNQQKFQIPNQPQTTSQTSQKQKISKAIIYELFFNQTQTSNISIEEYLYKRIFQPFLKEYQDKIKEISKNVTNNNKAKKELKEIFKNLCLIFHSVNSLQNPQIIHTQVKVYLKNLLDQIFSQIKVKLEQKERLGKKQSQDNVSFLKMSLPSNNNQLMLCISQIIKMAERSDELVTKNNFLNDNIKLSCLQLSSTLWAEIKLNLPLIFNFINKICISDFKALDKSDVLRILKLLRDLQILRSSRQQNNDVLLQFDIKVYQHLYSSLSMQIMNVSDRGKYYLKMLRNKNYIFYDILRHFSQKKEIFKKLESKKKLTILQLILAQLIRKKFLKINSPHLKRSQHAHILMSFLQIFEYPQNLTIDLKKIIEQTNFNSGDLQGCSSQVLERFSDLNFSISEFLSDNKKGLASSKKLHKLTIDELKKQFQSGRSSKIYEMILRNRNYSLPIELPQPKSQDINSKLNYILEKIYQSIKTVNNYNIIKRKSNQPPEQTRSKYSGKRTKRNNTVSQAQVEDDGFFADEKPTKTPKSQRLQRIQRGQRAQRAQKRVKKQQSSSSNLQTQQQASSPFNNFLTVNLSAQKKYIKQHSLVSHSYEEHYKMRQNKLPTHYKKQTWKNMYGINKEDQIQSLQIDQKIDQNIYKNILLALVGYVEKIKIVCRQFHAHSFIQYIVAQLDMEVYFHGCVARVYRKGKPQENMLFVCSTQRNYKLLYICTHILRESGQNAYILPQNVRDSDFKQFLQEILPQAFEREPAEDIGSNNTGKNDAEDVDIEGTKEQN